MLYWIKSENNRNNGGITVAQRITHTVFFKLHTTNATPFLEKSLAQLKQIPYPENFRILKQISSKNQFEYGFSMEFSNQEAYDLYSAHPIHNEYVAKIWLLEVAEFMEIDYVSYWCGELDV